MTWFARLRLGAAMGAMLVLAGCAVSHGRIDQTAPVAELNAPNGLALEGYDAVSYFADGAPARGSDAHVYRWKGARWLFASAEHRAAFAAAPERYAPQFGGYCAYAISHGQIADADPEDWAVVEDRLYLNYNGLAQALWDRGRAERIAAGKENWPLIPKIALSP